MNTIITNNKISCLIKYILKLTTSNHKRINLVSFKFTSLLRQIYENVMNVFFFCDFLRLGKKTKYL